MSGRLLRGLFAAGGAITATAGGAVETLPEAMLRGDADYGAYLATGCESCHQSAATAGAIPALKGRPRSEIILALRAYQQKERPNPQMQMIAGGLSDEQISALGAYFETAEAAKTGGN